MTCARQTTKIATGTAVRITTALGQELDRIALSGIVMGHDFQVVWVCRPEEWVEAVAQGRSPEGVPWPIEDVKVVQA